MTNTINLRKLSRPGCVPCVVLGNLLDANAERLAMAGVEYTEHDITEEPELVDKYGITGVPVLVVERDGAEVQRFVGMVTEGQLFKALEDARNESE